MPGFQNTPVTVTGDIIGASQPPQANPYLAASDVPGPMSTNPYASAQPVDFSGQTLQVGPLDTRIPLPAGIDAELAGAGKYFHDKYLGALQLSGSMSNAISHLLPWAAHSPFLVSDEQMKAINDRAAPSPADAALMQDPQAQAGYMTAGTATLGAAPVSTIPGVAITAATNAALDPAPNAAARLTNMGKAAATAAVTQGVINRGAAAVAGTSVNPSRDELIQQADRLGFETSPAQQTGSPTLATVEQGLSTLPLSSGVMSNAYQGPNQITANRIIARSIGQDADYVTPDVLNQATQDIGQRFENFSNLPNKVQFGPDFASALNDIRQNELTLAPNLQNQDVLNLVDQLSPPGLTNVRYPTSVVMANRSRLGSASADAFAAGDSAKGQAYGQIVDAIDDSIANTPGIPQSAQDSYALARQQWQNLLAVRKAADPTAEGNISLLKLNAPLKSQNPQAWAQAPWGQNDLIDLARLGQGLKDIVPNSGTAQRVASASFLSDLVPMGAEVLGGGAAGAHFAGIPGALAGAAAPLVPWITAKAYTSTPGAAIARALFPGAAPPPSLTAQLLMNQADQAAGMLPAYARAVQ